MACICTPAAHASTPTTHASTPAAHASAPAAQPAQAHLTRFGEVGLQGPLRHSRLSQQAHTHTAAAAGCGDNRGAIGGPRNGPSLLPLPMLLLCGEELQILIHHAEVVAVAAGRGVCTERGVGKRKRARIDSAGTAHGRRERGEGGLSREPQNQAVYSLDNSHRPFLATEKPSNGRRTDSSTCPLSHSPSTTSLTWSGQGM